MSHAQEIADFLVSRETLVSVGYSDDMAVFLLNEYNNYMANPIDEVETEDIPDDFLDFILKRLRRDEDTWSERRKDWRCTLNSYGMSSEFEAAMMDPAFDYLRTSESCRHWTKETITMRYAARWADFLQRSAQPGSPAAGTSRSPGFDLRTFGASASALASARVPGCTMLYKAMDETSISGMRGLWPSVFDESGNLRDLASLLSHTPSDFSADQSRYCFTPDYRVAEYHAAYIKRRIGTAAVCIVSLAIPNAALEQMQSAGELVRLSWPSDEWKETLWLSRRRQLLPSHLERVDEAALVVGTAARRPNAAYHQLRSFDEVTEDHVFKAEHMNPDADPSVQFVFHYKSIDFLKKHAAQTMRVTPFLDSDLATWLQTHGTDSTTSA